MKKILITFVAIVVLSAVLPGYVGAQAYTTTAGCLVLSNDLSLGMQGSDVSQLQGFLAEQGYSGGLSESSYFGQATQQAVVGFQSAHGIPGTGYVGSLTRAALANCQYLASSYASSYAYPAQYQNQYQYQSYPYTNPAPLAYTSQYSYAPVISSVSPTVAAPGDTVIIYGNGFDSQGNSVSAGGVQVRNLPSYNGTSLSFAVPANLYGTVAVYVTSSHGTSNSVSLAVSGSPPAPVPQPAPQGWCYSGQGTYPYCNCYNYYSCPAVTTAPTPPSTSLRPQIANVSGPTTIAAGTSGTWNISVLSPYYSQAMLAVSWSDQGYGYTPQTQAVASGQTASFSHTYYQPGTYVIVFIISDGSGDESTATETVTVYNPGTGYGTGYYY